MGEVIAIVALSIPIIIAPFAIGFRFARQSRELEHRERMKALELGRTLSKDEPWCTPARISLTIGAGVPIGVFTCAWLATASSGFQQDIWLSSMSVGVTSVICGSVLAAKHFTHRANAEALAYRASFEKPTIDEDAYDVVGRRG
jgi:hypothetical protein